MTHPGSVGVGAVAGSLAAIYSTVLSRITPRVLDPLDGQTYFGECAAMSACPC